MNKSEKKEQIDVLHDKLSRATFVATIAFSKLDAITDIELRRAMRAAKIEYKVVKNKLALIAARGTPVDALAAQFKGPVAVAVSYGDMVEAAKAVTEFVKKQPEKLKIKGAVADGSALDAAGVEALSKMPGLPETRAQLLALINTPATMLVRLLNEPGARVARVVQANVDKQQAGAQEAA